MTNSIEEVLRQKGWTQLRLAQEAGLQPAHVNKVIRNTANPRVDTAIRIARALGKKVEDLWKS